MNGDHLRLEAERRHGMDVLAVSGALKATTCGAFAEAAMRAVDDSIYPLLMDLSGLTYVDCQGARTLASLTRSLPPGKLAGVRFLRPHVRRALALLDLDLEHSPRGGGKVLEQQIRELLKSRAQESHSRAQAAQLQAGAVLGQLSVTYAKMAGTYISRNRLEHAGRLARLSLAAREQSMSSRTRFAALRPAARHATGAPPW